MPDRCEFHPSRCPKWPLDRAGWCRTCLLDQANADAQIIAELEALLLTENERATRAEAQVSKLEERERAHMVRVRCAWCRETSTGAWVSNFGVTFCKAKCEKLWTAMVKRRLDDE